MTTRQTGPFRRSPLVVDAGTAPMADKVLAAIRTISKKPLRIMASSTSVS